MKNIVVFDFDGTLSARDANSEFWKFALCRSARPWLMLPLAIAGLLIRPLNPTGAFWREISHRYLSAALMKKLRAEFLSMHLKNRFGWAAEQVAAERRAGNFVVCISAGPDFLVPDLVRDMNFDLVLCSLMDKARPWKYKFLCYGKNKVAALERAIKTPYKIVRAYSDNRSDMPIMSLASDRVWINPRTGCRRITA